MIDKKFIDKQKKIIEKSIARLEKEVALNKKFEDIGNSPDDTTQEYEAFEEKQALIRTAQKDLKELKIAIGKIENGKYGLCEADNKPIERGRLEAYPAARRCVTHASQK